MTTDPTVARLMHANLLEVFNERDPKRRSEAIEQTYADDVRWTEDSGVTVGRAALAAKAEALRQKLGELDFVVASPVHQTHELGYLAFDVVPAGGGPAVDHGFDVAIIADGRIAKLYTVLTGG
jgi:hypothetical protein